MTTNLKNLRLFSAIFGKSLMVLLVVGLLGPAVISADPIPGGKLVNEEEINKGKALFQTKICFTCHQTDPKVPSPAGAAMKAPAFMGPFWGQEREVHVGIGGPLKKVKMDEQYFIESVEKPFDKILKGALPGMAPLPTTPEERQALMEYVKSLSK